MYGHNPVLCNLTRDIIHKAGSAELHCLGMKVGAQNLTRGGGRRPVSSARCRRRTRRSNCLAILSRSACVASGMMLPSIMSCTGSTCFAALHKSAFTSKRFHACGMQKVRLLETYSQRQHKGQLVFALQPIIDCRS